MACQYRRELYGADASPRRSRDDREHLSLCIPELSRRSRCARNNSAEDARPVLLNVGKKATPLEDCGKVPFEREPDSAPLSTKELKR